MPTLYATGRRRSQVRFGGSGGSAASTLRILEAAKAAPRKYARPDAAGLLVVGDRAKIEAVRRELQLGEIVLLDGEGKPAS